MNCSALEPGAHRAGLQGDIQRCAVESPVREGLGCLRQHQHLGMCRRIPKGLPEVVGSGDDPSLMDDDRPDRDLLLLEGGRRLDLHLPVPRPVRRNVARWKLWDRR